MILPAYHAFGIDSVSVWPEISGGEFVLLRSGIWDGLTFTRSFRIVTRLRDHQHNVDYSDTYCAEQGVDLVSSVNVY